MNITRDDVIQIVKEIVRLWPYSKCTQPDTFAIVDNASQLESDNLGKTYQDYLNGHFWSRSWVLSGADPNKLKKAYPMILLEQKNATRETFDDRETCWEWWFVLADIPDCVTCGDCNRSKDTIDTELQVMALSLTDYLSQIKLITFDNTHLVWTTTQQAQKYITDGLYSTYTVDSIDITQYIRNSVFNVSPGSLGLTDSARSAIFSLTICSCVDTPTSLSTFTGADAVATTKCKTC
jgi:hypothetical protein